LLIRGNWLIVESGDTVKLLLHRPSIKPVWKHFSQTRGYSMICTGEGCSFCLHGAIKRPRYIARVILEGQNLSWEFGDEVYIDLPQPSDPSGYISIVVTRVGRGRSTAYQIHEYNPELPLDVPINIFKCSACGGYIFPRNYYTDKLPQCKCRVIKLTEEVPVVDRSSDMV